MSYADVAYQQWKDDNPLPLRKAPRQHGHQNTDAENRPQTRFSPVATEPVCVSSPPSADETVYAIPDEVFNQTVGHYDRNQFARLLGNHFGTSVASDLLQRFQVGTSARWPGASVFWFIDEQDRKRGGQIKLFRPDWHTEKYVDREGRNRAKVDWVHSAMRYRFEKAGTPIPAWLSDYIDKGERSPCLFGLPQLLTVTATQPVAIVEAPKTAILCTPYFPQFTWLAAGSLSYLNAERLTPVRNRRIVLFPDMATDGKAFNRWSRIADQLRTHGFSITVSDYLEKIPATDQQRQDGLDLADYLTQYQCPDSGRGLTEPNGYPALWDAPNVPDAVPSIRVISCAEFSNVNVMSRHLMRWG